MGICAVGIPIEFQLYLSSFLNDSDSCRSRNRVSTSCESTCVFILWRSLNINNAGSAYSGSYSGCCAVVFCCYCTSRCVNSNLVVVLTRTSTFTVFESEICRIVRDVFILTKYIGSIATRAITHFFNTNSVAVGISNYGNNNRKLSLLNLLIFYLYIECARTIDGIGLRHIAEGLVVVVAVEGDSQRGCSCRLRNNIGKVETAALAE